MDLILPSDAHVLHLGEFSGEIYTPESHNMMVARLAANGIGGDLDAHVQAFVNVRDDIAGYVLKRAKELRKRSLDGERFQVYPEGPSPDSRLPARRHERPGDRAGARL